jgi:hypothetical protein
LGECANHARIQHRRGAGRERQARPYSSVSSTRRGAWASAGSPPRRITLAFAAHARHLFGDIATHSDRFDTQLAETQYRHAMTLAEALAMRPLVAHCHFGLGRLWHRTVDRVRADEHLTAAATMYREVDMRFWLEGAATELTGVGRRPPSGRRSPNRRPTSVECQARKPHHRRSPMPDSPQAGPGNGRAIARKEPHHRNPRPELSLTEARFPRLAGRPRNATRPTDWELAAQRVISRPEESSGDRPSRDAISKRWAISGRRNSKDKGPGPIQSRGLDLVAGGRIVFTATGHLEICFVVVV